jgi:hypothetical protein
MNLRFITPVAAIWGIAGSVIAAGLRISLVGYESMREATSKQIGRLDVIARLLEKYKLRFNTLQRVLLYIAASVWFMVYVLSQQINYQDAWILDGILWPFVALIAICLYVIGTEKDNRVVALLSAWTILVVTLIPSLKYEQPYGTAIDATDHFIMVENLMATGRVLEDHTYSSIPAMHSWLTSLGLVGGLSDITALKVGLPLTGMLMPLLIYWWTRYYSIPDDMIKYMIAASCLSAFPYYLPNGTGFTVVPLVFLLATVLIRQTHANSKGEQFVYMLVVMIILFQITVWHSTTPMLIPLLFAGLTLTPRLSRLFGGSAPPPSAKSFLRLSLLTGIMFIGYRLLVDDPVFREILLQTNEILDSPGSGGTPLPKKAFEVTKLDLLVTAYLIHGRALMLYALTALGTLVLWRSRSLLQPAVSFYVYLLLIFAMFAALILVSIINGVAYLRYINASLAFAPFFVGPLLWWVNNVMLRRLFRSQILSKLIGISLISLLVTYIVLDFFTLQPLVPRVQSPEGGEPEDYLVWLHGVNSAYQQRVITFAEDHIDPKTRFAIDHTGRIQFIRYSGEHAGLRRGLHTPLKWREEVDPTKVDYFLLHWPGPAGGLTETVEFRSNGFIEELRETPTWGLVYDNGESFILWVQ